MSSVSSQPQLQKQLTKDSEESKPKRPLSPHKLLAQFDNLPSKAIQKKIDFYYLPYNSNYRCSKYMHFEKTQTPYITEQTMRFLQTPGLDINDRKEIEEFFASIQEEQQGLKDIAGWKKMDAFIFKFDPEIQQYIISTLHKILNQKKLYKKKYRRKNKKSKRKQYNHYQTTFGGDEYDQRNIISLNIENRSTAKKEKVKKSSFFDRMSKPKTKHFSLEANEVSLKKSKKDSKSKGKNAAFEKRKSTNKEEHFDTPKDSISQGEPSKESSESSSETSESESSQNSETSSLATDKSLESSQDHEKSSQISHGSKEGAEGESLGLKRGHNIKRKTVKHSNKKQLMKRFSIRPKQRVQSLIQTKLSQKNIGDSGSAGSTDSHHMRDHQVFSLGSNEARKEGSSDLDVVSDQQIEEKKIRVIEELTNESVQSSRRTTKMSKDSTGTKEKKSKLKFGWRTRRASTSAGKAPPGLGEFITKFQLSTFEAQRHFELELTKGSVTARRMSKKNTKPVIEPAPPTGRDQGNLSQQTRMSTSKSPTTHPGESLKLSRGGTTIHNDGGDEMVMSPLEAAKSQFNKTDNVKQINKTKRLKRVVMRHPVFEEGYKPQQTAPSMSQRGLETIYNVPFGPPSRREKMMRESKRREMFNYSNDYPSKAKQIKYDQAAGFHSLYAGSSTLKSQRKKSPMCSSERKDSTRGQSQRSRNDASDNTYMLRTSTNDDTNPNVILNENSADNLTPGGTTTGAFILNQAAPTSRGSEIAQASGMIHLPDSVRVSDGGLPILQNVHPKYVTANDRTLAIPSIDESSSQEQRVTIPALKIPSNCERQSRKRMILYQKAMENKQFSIFNSNSSSYHKQEFPRTTKASDDLRLKEQLTQVLPQVPAIIAGTKSFSKPRDSIGNQSPTNSTTKSNRTSVKAYALKHQPKSPEYRSITQGKAQRPTQLSNERMNLKTQYQQTRRRIPQAEPFQSAATPNQFPLIRSRVNTIQEEEQFLGVSLESSQFKQHIVPVEQTDANFDIFNEKIGNIKKSQRTPVENRRGNFGSNRIKLKNTFGQSQVSQNSSREESLEALPKNQKNPIPQKFVTLTSSYKHPKSIFSPKNESQKKVEVKFGAGRLTTGSGSGSVTQRVNVPMEQPNYFSRRNIIPQMCVQSSASPRDANSSLPPTEESPQPKKKRKNPYTQRQQFMGLVHNFPLISNSGKAPGARKKSRKFEHRASERISNIKGLTGSDQNGSFVLAESSKFPLATYSNALIERSLKGGKGSILNTGTDTQSDIQNDTTFLVQTQPWSDLEKAQIPNGGRADTERLLLQTKNTEDGSSIELQQQSEILNNSMVLQQQCSS